MMTLIVAFVACLGLFAVGLWLLAVGVGRFLAARAAEYEEVGE